MEYQSSGKTVWQIRYLKDSAYRSESEQILALSTNYMDILSIWRKDGYEKENDTFGLFKVVYERVE